jgi:hypothetical protein
MLFPVFERMPKLVRDSGMVPTLWEQGHDGKYVQVNPNLCLNSGLGCGNLLATPLSVATCLFTCLSDDGTALRFPDKFIAKYCLRQVLSRDDMASIYQSFKSGDIAHAIEDVSLNKSDFGPAAALRLRDIRLLGRWTPAIQYQMGLMDASDIVWGLLPRSGFSLKTPTGEPAVGHVGNTYGTDACMLFVKSPTLGQVSIAMSSNVNNTGVLTVALGMAELLYVITPEQTRSVETRVADLVAQFVSKMLHLPPSGCVSYSIVYRHNSTLTNVTRTIPFSPRSVAQDYKFLWGSCMTKFLSALDMSAMLLRSGDTADTLWTRMNETSIFDLVSNDVTDWGIDQRKMNTSGGPEADEDNPEPKDRRFLRGMNALLSETIPNADNVVEPSLPFDRSRLSVASMACMVSGLRDFGEDATKWGDGGDFSLSPVQWVQTMVYPPPREAQAQRALPRRKFGLHQTKTKHLSTEPVLERSALTRSGFGSADTGRSPEFWTL